MKRSLFLGGAASVLLVPAVANAASLRARVVATAKQMPGAVGVYARLLGAREPLVAYRAHEQFPTASTIKLLIMTTAYVLDEQRSGVLDERIAFDRSTLIAGSDFMTNARDGEVFTVRELIVPMITVSDNTAANMLIDHFGVETINEVGLKAGLTQTHLGRKFLDWNAIVRHSDNLSTPADLGHLCYLIDKGAREGVQTIASPAHCRTMVGILLGQTDRDGIPAALPPGTPIGNKTGEMTGTRNDVAIVRPFGEQPFVLAIMTKAAYDYPASYAAIHSIARTVYGAASASATRQ